MLNIVIFEDEEFSFLHLKKLLKKYCIPQFNIVNVSQDIKDAIKWLKCNDSPDLIFSDIHLADGKCFEIFKEVHVSAPIIFTTAYDEYAIKAFKTSGIEYLLKPLNEKEFINALEKFNKLSTDNFNKIENINNTAISSSNKRLLTKLGNKYFPIKIEEIAYVYKDEIIYIILFNGNKYPLNTSIESIQKTLNSDIFFRANRQLLININAIEFLSQYKAGQLSLQLKPRFDKEIVLSQEKSSNLKSVLN